MSPLRVLLAGDEAAGHRALKLLERSTLSVVGVATSADDPKSRLRAGAKELGAPVLDARVLGRDSGLEELAALSPDVLLNIHSLTKVSASALDLFAVGAWNLHPGPLPEAAGINVPSWAVALSWTEHGVTVHRMTSEYDAGDIAYQDRFSIPVGATGLRLSAECARRGMALVSGLIGQLEEDAAGVPRIAQDLAARAYYGRGQPNDGRIDWNESAERIVAHVRAADFRPFPSPWHEPIAEIDGEPVGLVEVSIGSRTSATPGTCARLDGELSVAATDHWIMIHEMKSVSV